MYYNRDSFLYLGALSGAFPGEQNLLLTRVFRIYSNPISCIIRFAVGITSCTGAAG